MNLQNETNPSSLIARFQDEATRLASDWGWLLFFGIVYVALGIFALYEPLLTTLGITVTLATLFLVVGVIQLVQAMRIGRGGGALGRFAQAVIAIILAVQITLVVFVILPTLGAAAPHLQFGGGGL